MDEETLEYMYREELDERLIAYLAKVKNLSLFKAMDIYYHSRMAEPSTTKSTMQPVMSSIC